MKPAMADAAALIAQIAAAFADVRHPGADALTDSAYGEEPAALVEAFAALTDWTDLDAGFLDLAPAGWATALAFFSAPALRFYQPAYMIADLRGELAHCDPVTRLCLFVTPQGGARRLAAVFGGGTMGERAREDFAIFTPVEVRAIVAYLWWKLDQNTGDPIIEQALEYYWLEREAESGDRAGAPD